MLRIYGNRRLKTLPGLTTRPTTSRVRESLFNIWQGDLSNCHWLDLCAGIGSIGAEALARGAASVFAIEQSHEACAVIRQNWQTVVQPHQQFVVYHGKLPHILSSFNGQQFDRIYFDPPYTSPIYDGVIRSIVDNHLLSPEGELAVEHHPSWELPPLPVGLEVCREKIYGNSSLTFFQVRSFDNV